MTSERVSGVLLHVTSLPSYGGVGDFGPAAFAFIDFLAAAKQRLWQVLPLNPTGYGSSPYSALSAFAGNPLLISLEKLVDAGWLTSDRIAGLPGHNGPCDFDRAFVSKRPLVEEAAANFLDRATDDERAEITISRGAKYRRRVKSRTGRDGGPPHRGDLVGGRTERQHTWKCTGVDRADLTGPPRHPRQGSAGRRGKRSSS